MGGSRSLSVPAVFAAVVLIGGTNFLAVRYSNQELAPFWGATLRFAVVGALFFALMAVRRTAIPRGAALVGAIVYGLPNFGLFYAFGYWGLLSAPSALASVIVALVPLFTMFLASAVGLERLHARGIAGAVVATVGVGVVFREQLAAATPLTSILAFFGMAACSAVATVAAKRFPRTDPIATNAVGIVPGVAFLAVLSLVAGESWALPAQAPAQLALLYLITVGGVGLFAGVLYVLTHWSASASSYVTVLFPLVTTVEGALVAREPISAAFVAGALLVMSGVYFGSIRGGQRRARPPEVVRA
jgi:drug/metabolite transporter (DMT)-like permease